MARVALIGSDIDANFSITTSTYTAGAGEWGYAFVATKSGAVDTLKIRISTSGTAANWRLLIRSLGGAILANATVAAGENLTRSVSVTPFAVVAGTTYRLHFSVNTGTVRPFQNSTQGTVGQDTSSTYASPETIWVSDSAPGTIRQYQMWAEGEETLAYDIDSVNGDNTITPGQVNTAVVSGYVAGVNPIVSGTVGSLALTSVSQSVSTVSFTPPAPTSGAYWPEPNTTKTLTLTDGSNPATFDAPFNSLDYFTSVVLVDPDNADIHKLPYHFTVDAVDDDRIMYKPADLTVGADGGITDATLDIVTPIYHWVAATSFMYEYAATLYNGQLVDVRSLTSVGLTAGGLTSAGLTLVGL